MENLIPRWNLADIYSSKDSEDLKKDLTNLANLIDDFVRKYKNNVKAKLTDSIIDYEKISDLCDKIMAYAYMLFSIDYTNEENAKFYQDMSEKITDLSGKTIFYTLEINKIDDKELEDLLKNEKLSKYRPWLRDIRVMRPYQLSDEVEKLLHDKSITSFSSWVRLYDEIAAGLEFTMDGKKLTMPEITDFFSDKDPELRKKAAKTFGNKLGEHVKTFSLIMNVLVKDKQIEDNLRGFKEPISSRNISNLIEDEVVDALISTVKEAYPSISHRFYKLKAKLLGMDKMYYWDRRAPLPDASTDRFSFEEAKNIVLSSYREFSPEAAEIGELFFKNNWIDAVPSKGKDSGAYSHPASVSTHPYILMNYKGKIQDIMTLAHELGHGIHQYLAREQGPLMCSTPLTLAETASVFGEQLTFRNILKNQKDEKAKKIIIAGKIEDMLSTVVRQIAICEFERKVHNKRREGELLPDEICNIWLETQKECLGDIFIFDEEYKYYWSYISHVIQVPFYVYAYAFGDCLVNSLYQVYLEKPEGFAKKYLDMLKAGGTLRHHELLAPFGLDSKDPGFWRNGLKLISNFIDEIE